MRTRQTVRLHDACSAAIDRCAEKESVVDDPDIFADLGEALFWLVALAEARGKHKGSMLLSGSPVDA
jgi:hypothetical protein